MPASRWLKQGPAWSGSPALLMRLPTSRRTTSLSQSCAQICWNFPSVRTILKGVLERATWLQSRSAPGWGEVREAIADEQKRLAGSFGKDYELARAQYDEFSATITR